MTKSINKTCKHCGAETPKKLKVCQECGKFTKNWFARHKVITGLIAIALLATYGGIAHPNSDVATKTEDTTKSSEVATAPAPAPTKTTTETKPAPAPAPAKPTVTNGQKNALKSAKNYLNFTAFSKYGLVKQLEYDKYEEADCMYAVENCGANWNEEAMKSAKNYLKTMSFSKEQLKNQLVYDKFTDEQAQYGVDHAY